MAVARIEVLPDVILDKGVIHAQIQGSVDGRNERVETDDGSVSANIIWPYPRRTWDLATVPLLRAHWMQLEALHGVTKQGGYGFLMLDPHDHIVLATGVSTGVVSDLGGGTYQLERALTEPLSGRIALRKITRPMLSGFTAYVSGVALTGVGSPADHSLDEDTGILSIPSAPAAANVTWVGKFYVPVHFLDDSIKWGMLRPASDPDRRLFAGPTITLQEVRE